MVAKDGVDAKKIRVQGFGLQPEMLSYSRDELMSAVISLEGEYSEHKYDFFQRNISRLQGFVHSAVFPDWNTFMGRVFADSGLTATPSGRMREVIKKWTPLSAFVLTGGNSDLSIAGLPVTLKNISGYLSVVNGRAVMNSGAGEYEDNPWAGKRQSGRKVSAGPVMESSGPGVGVMESAGPVMESAGPGLAVMMKSAGPGLAVTMKSAGLAVTMKSAGLAVMNSAGAGVVTKNGLLQGRKFLPTIIAANIFKRIVLGY